MKRYVKLLLVAIIVIAAVLRFFHLGINPPSLTWDEVAWGYNAYSIGIDGKDEFGRYLPHDYLESFGDFKPPMYAYLDVLPVKLFGLTEFATRFPSAFFGVLTVLITYFLVKQLFATSVKKEWYALVSAFILAVSPWHIMLSRAAFEANVATFFLVTGIWLFLVSVGEKKWLLLVSAVSFVLSLYTFNTSRIVAPLLVAVLALGFSKRLFTIKREVILAAVIGIVFLLPILGFLLSPNAALRFKEVNIFSNLDIVKASNEQIEEDNNSIVGKFFHNRRFAFAHEYLRHYFDNLSPNFLFLEGDGNPKFSIQSVGQMYIWDIVFFFLGILYLFKLKEGNGWILPVWILLGIIPAATARETPHALRIETTLPAFQIFVAYGFVNCITDIKRRAYGIPLQPTIFALSSLLLFVNIAYFWHAYTTHYPKQFSSEWQSGYKEAVSYATTHQNSYENIYFSEDMGRPYIYYLFYSKFDPKQFRKDAVVERDIFGFVHVAQVGKYHFVTGFPQDTDKKNLYVAYVNKIEDYDAKVPKNAKVLKRINRLNGKIVLVIYTI